MIDVNELQLQQNDILKRIMIARLHGKSRIYYKTTPVKHPELSKKIIKDLLYMDYTVNYLFSLGKDCVLFEILTKKKSNFSY